MSKYLLIDSREKTKAIKTIISEIERQNIPYIISKLPFGDYCDWNRPGIVIDRKQNIAELTKNCTTDHVRFKAELERAKAAGAKLVVLVEQNRYKCGDRFVPVNDITDIIYWSNPHTTIRGEKVYRVLRSWCARYDLEVQFCDKRCTGKRILQIIYGENYVR